MGGTTYQFSCPKEGVVIREGGGAYYKNRLPNRGLIQGVNRGGGLNRAFTVPVSEIVFDNHFYCSYCNLVLKSRENPGRLADSLFLL